MYIYMYMYIYIYIYIYSKYGLHVHTGIYTNILCKTRVKLVTVPRAKLLRLGYSYRQALNAYLFQRS